MSLPQDPDGHTSFFEEVHSHSPMMYLLTFGVVAIIVLTVVLAGLICYYCTRFLVTSLSLTHMSIYACTHVTLDVEPCPRHPLFPLLFTVSLVTRTSHQCLYTNPTHRNQAYTSSMFGNKGSVMERYLAASSQNNTYVLSKS